MDNSSAKRLFFFYSFFPVWTRFQGPPIFFLSLFFFQAPSLYWIFTNSQKQKLKKMRNIVLFQPFSLPQSRFGDKNSQILKYFFSKNVFGDNSKKKRKKLPFPQNGTAVLKRIQPCEQMPWPCTKQIENNSSTARTYNRFVVDANYSTMVQQYICQGRDKRDSLNCLI